MNVKYDPNPDWLCDACQSAADRGGWRLEYRMPTIVIEDALPKEDSETIALCIPHAVELAHKLQEALEEEGRQYATEKP